VNNLQIPAEQYHEFRRFLEDACGIVLGENKHYLVTSRLGRLMREFEIADFGDLLRRLQRDPRSPLRERIVDAMTTNETLWFRDNYPYEVLRQAILPDFANRRLRQLRIWSAACSSGQEPYSISIALQEFAAGRPGALPSSTQIVGTDISPSMLRHAAAARYDNMALARGISEDRRNRFFTRHGDVWELKPEIRQRVTFRELNLMHSYTALGQFELIFLRNVLIYFSNELKRDILQRTAQQLAPDGYLFLGGSESPMSYSDAFRMERTPHGVVYRHR